MIRLGVLAPGLFLCASLSSGQPALESEVKEMGNSDSASQDFGFEDVEWRLREIGLSITPDLMAELALLTERLPVGNVPIEEAVTEYTQFSKKAIATVALKMSLLEKQIIDLESGNEA